MNADQGFLHLTIKSSSELDQEFAYQNRTLEQTRIGIMAMSQFWGITFCPFLNECASSMFNSKKIRKGMIRKSGNEIGFEIDSTETN